MQNVGTSLLAVIESDQYDFVDLFEFYSFDETSLTPDRAALRVCNTALYHNGYGYTQYAITRGDVSRYVDGRFNTCTITLSNIDRAMASFALLDIEGMRVVIRMISRRVDDDSLVLFIGRCEKPAEISNTEVQVTIKQDLGSIENDIPWRTFGPKCQVAGGFKGVECLAGESLVSKDAAYQAASTCNFSYPQCSTYGNLEAIQAWRFNSKNGNFKVSAQRGGAGGAILSLIGLGQKKVTKQWSSQDDMPWGKAIPLGFGRTQLQLVGILHADTGQYIAGQSVVGEGEISDLINVRNVSSGFATTFQAYAQHLGKYGTDSSQIPAGFFTTGGDTHSHTAYVEYTVKGNNPDTGDAAPNIIGVVLWSKIPYWDGSSFTGSVWSDNPAEILRYIMIEPRSLDYDSSWIDTTSWGIAADYCNQPMLDTSGNEDYYVSDRAGTAGTDFKRYRSTGLLDTYHFRKVLGVDSTYPQAREVTYNTFDPTAPPASPTASTWYRRRYTANFHVIEKTKVADFLFKTLLPAFKGYLITGSDGKLQLKIDKPLKVQYARGVTLAGDTAIAIEDATAFTETTLPVRFALVDTSALQECVRISSVQFSTAGNAITLAKAVTGTITATLSGSTLSGGSTSVQASGTVTIGGTITATNTVQVTIDGYSVTYTIGADDTTGTIAGMLATMINADTTLNRFVKATWSSSSPTIVTIKSKLGTLNLTEGMVHGHGLLAEIQQVHAQFADFGQDILNRANILRDSFRWPLGNKQSSYNQFVLTYLDAVQDFQTTEIRENDYTHQAKINKINKLDIEGACIDNYHQADRLLQSARYKYREGNFFGSWSSIGLPLLLEEGDIVCLTHDNYPGGDYLTLRLEEVKVNAKHEVSMTGRLYDETQYPESAAQKTIPLTSGLGWPTAAPGAATALALTTPANGTIRGTFTFANYVGAQYARIEVKKAGSGAFVDSGVSVKPDTSGNGYFELPGLPGGSTQVRVVSWNELGNNSSTTSASTISVSGLGGSIEVTETDTAPDVTNVDKLIFHKDSVTDEGGGDVSYKPIVAIEFVIDGGGSAITTGEKGHLEIPFDCTILQASLLADQSGSIVVDIWKDVYANFPPTVADTITASAKPTLSSAQKAQDSTLTGWTTTITAGDVLAFKVDSATTVTRVVLSLKCRRS